MSGVTAKTSRRYCRIFGPHPPTTLIAPKAHTQTTAPKAHVQTTTAPKAHVQTTLGNGRDYSHFCQTVNWRKPAYTYGREMSVTPPLTGQCIAGEIQRQRGDESAILIFCEKECSVVNSCNFRRLNCGRASELVLMLGDHVSFRLAPFLPTDQ